MISMFEQVIIDDSPQIQNLRVLLHICPALRIAQSEILPTISIICLFSLTLASLHILLVFILLEDLVKTYGFDLCSQIRDTFFDRLFLSTDLHTVQVIILVTSGWILKKHAFARVQLVQELFLSVEWVLGWGSWVLGLRIQLGNRKRNIVCWSR